MPLWKLQPVKQLLKDDQWAVAEIQHTSGPGLIRFRQPVLAPRDCRSHPHRLSITWAYAEEGSGQQLPDNEVGQEMGRFEDHLTAAVEADAHAVLTGVLTFDGARQWVFYTRDVSEFADRLSRIPDYHGEPYPIELETDYDATWSYLRDQILGGVDTGA
ncbi:DUF695 domain-containing protein [Pseudobythopirellula maris]|uniref:DUF695 domain-containing protein n=1 Tax=Pseudobythopirellula maris TaxID=2527991 RepID=UPI0011B71FD2|nr:DUF695 domain-containing protein [Pseudobythopirellula maris]